MRVRCVWLRVAWTVRGAALFVGFLWGCPLNPTVRTCVLLPGREEFRRKVWPSYYDQADALVKQARLFLVVLTRA